MSKEMIDQEYLDQANQLEAEFFDIEDMGKPTQHRVLKDSKTVEEFNLRHSEVWRNHEVELVAEGLIEVPVMPEPVRNLASEIDDLKSRILDLEEKTTAP